ncbi:MAG: hypothetical protein JWO60_1587 [Frankiales bacterium]|nr:hypothetical protein [Frankiales bacterium]
MSVRRLALLAPVLALGLLAPLAHAEYVPVLATQDLFLTCDGGTSKEYFTNEVAGDAQPTWSTTAPASVTTGAGCGKLDDGAFSGADFRTPYQFGFGGGYTGNLDAVTVTLHSAHVSQGRPTGAPVDLDVRMTVDGISMFGTTEQAGATGDVFQIPAGRTVRVTPTLTGSTGQVTQYAFTVTGLGLLLEGDAAEHEIAFDIASGDLGVEGWLWGAAEAASGVTVTPAKPAAAAVKADPRAKREEGLFEQE